MQEASKCIAGKALVLLTPLITYELRLNHQDLQVEKSHGIDMMNPT